MCLLRIVSRRGVDTFAYGSMILAALAILILHVLSRSVSAMEDKLIMIAKLVIANGR